MFRVKSVQNHFCLDESDRELSMVVDLVLTYGRSKGEACPSTLDLQ